MLEFVHALLWIIVLAAILASAWTDIRHRIIPNELVGVVAASGLCLTLMLRPDALWIGGLLAALLIVALGTLAHFGLMGGGDVKMIGAAALLFPPGHVGRLIVFIALAGGVLSLIYLILHRLARSRPASLPEPAAATDFRAGREQGWLSGEYARIAAGGPLPYAIAILGGVLGLIAGELMQCLPANSCSL